jgi:hypothetical protein
MGGVVNWVTDDVLGFDPNGGGIYNVANDILGDTIADDILGLDPNGGGIVPIVNTAANIAVSSVLGDAVGGLLSTPVTDASFIAADAAQLAAQGLGEAQIASTLAASGVSGSAASLAASMATNGVSESVMSSQLNNLSTNTGLTSIPTNDASFAAADATQLAQQLGSNTAAIEQNLVASGLDPMVSADITQQLALNPYVTQEQLANSLASFYDPSLYNDLSAQLGAQQSQLNLLAQQYEGLGFSQQEALNRAMSDMQTNVSSQINTQGQQFQTLLEQYQQLGMSSDEALRQTMSDMQTNTSGMFSDLGQQLASQQSTTSGLFDSVFNSLTNQNSILDTLTQLTLANTLTSIAPALFNNQTIQQAAPVPAYRPLQAQQTYTPEYFQQVQNYYTGYMPEVPRDVATPLQQWYAQGYTGPDQYTQAQFNKG